MSTITKLIKHKNSHCSDQNFLEEFLNGDCHTLAAQLWHLAKNEKMNAQIAHFTYIQFCHSFVIINENDTFYYIDARGVFTSLDEFLNDWKITESTLIEIKETLRNKEFNTLDIQSTSYYDLEESSQAFEVFETECEKLDLCRDKIDNALSDYLNEAVLFLVHDTTSKTSFPWTSAHQDHPLCHKYFCENVNSECKY